MPDLSDMLNNMPTGEAPQDEPTVPTEEPTSDDTTVEDGAESDTTSDPDDQYKYGPAVEEHAIALYQRAILDGIESGPVTDELKDKYRQAAIAIRAANPTKFANHGSIVVVGSLLTTPPHEDYNATKHMYSNYEGLENWAFDT